MPRETGATVIEFRPHLRIARGGDQDQLRAACRRDSVLSTQSSRLAGVLDDLRALIEVLSSSERRETLLGECDRLKAALEIARDKIRAIDESM